jgi:hypothetical protein
MNEEKPALISAGLETSSNNFKNVNITEEDKERYLKSMLADRAYEETIKLFDGQLALKFRVLTVQETNDVVAQILEDKKNGVASDTDSYFITISSYRLGLSLVSIDEKPYSNITKDNFISMKDGDSYVLARSKPMLSWPTPRLSAFLDAFQLFEAKVIKLTGEVQTSNFWKAST